MNPQRRSFLRGRVAPPRLAPRPPWALPEAQFAQACSRCDACISACPQAILARGDGGFPEVSFKLAGCTACGACVEACAPQALQRQPALWDWRAQIGPACLASQRVECRVCGEVCDHRAIRFAPTLGGVATPALNLDQCTGCGACVAPCPTQAITMRQPAQKDTSS